MDTVSYFDSNVGVTVNLETGEASGGFAEGDTIINVENISGSERFDNNLTGDSGNNGLTGGAGNDIINGGDGNDTLFGNGGQDILNGEEGDDRFSLYEWHDDLMQTVFDGGAGTDVVWVLPEFTDIPFEIDFANYDFRNIEQIRLTPDVGEENEYITISLQDVIDMTDENIELYIFNGSVTDTVTSTGQGWVQQADQNIDGIDYDVYTAGGATLYIETDITQDIS
ncbi:hypothetical protein LJF33_08965 [Emcibacteraceae bacterium Y4]|nr:hypothetical protein [Pseudemcibacter aquimaris]